MRPHRDPPTPSGVPEVLSEPCARRLDAELRAAGDPVHALDATRRALMRGLVRAPHAFYVRQGARFAAVASHRLAPVPGFAAEGSLVRAVRELGGPVTTVGSHRARRLCSRLDADDRAALRAMGTIALLPFLAGGELVAFLCVGGGFDTLDAARLGRTLAPLARRLERERSAEARDRATPPGTGAVRP